MILFAQAALAGCTPVTLAELGAIPAPAVFVLGERKGMQPDLWRASRLVTRLRKEGEPVTVALQAVSVDQQPVLDRYAEGEMEPEDLPALLDWNSTWGFPYAPYRRLVQGAVHGDVVLGIGHAVEAQPEGTISPRPPGYIQVLTDTMGGHYMPQPLEPGFTQTVSWLDHRMAASAVEGWSAEGYLVVVADRLHVEGGKGIAWQIQRLQEAPVTVVNLAGAGRCYTGDRHLGR